MYCDWLVEEILSELECPVCTEYMRPPILQCEKGHNVCNSCINKLKECPNCKGQFRKVRCLALERLSTKLIVPCKYSREGCNLLMTYYETVDHLNECEFQLLKCPLNRTGLKCKWEGLLSPLRNHIIEKHGILASKYKTSLDCIMKVPLAGSWYHVMIFNCDVLFRFTRVMDGAVNVCLFYVGPRKRASNFKYTISIETRNGDGVLSMTCIARHYLEDIEEVFASGHCCSFNKNFVMRCIHENKTLPMTVKISNDTPHTL